MNDGRKPKIIKKKIKNPQRLKKNSKGGITHSLLTKLIYIHNSKFDMTKTF